jgi:hypothetical protein
MLWAAGDCVVKVYGVFENPENWIVVREKQKLDHWTVDKKFDQFFFSLGISQQS